MEFLHEITEALERHYAAQLLRYYNANDFSQRDLDPRARTHRSAILITPGPRVLNPLVRSQPALADKLTARASIKMTRFHNTANRACPLHCSEPVARQEGSASGAMAVEQLSGNVRTSRQTGLAAG